MKPPVCLCPRCMTPDEYHEWLKQQQRCDDQAALYRGIFFVGFACGTVVSLAAYYLGQLMGRVM